MNRNRVTKFSGQKTAANNRFAAMLADETRHQVFVRLSAVVPA